LAQPLHYLGSPPKNLAGLPLAATSLNMAMLTFSPWPSMGDTNNALRMLLKGR
jgi:hypothetical protein